MKVKWQRVKRCLAVILCTGVLCQSFTVSAIALSDIERALTSGTALVEESIEAENGYSISDLRAQFPNGRYWNHADNPGVGNNNPMGTSATPCTNHDKTFHYNANTCNRPTFAGHYGCWGYADQLGYLYSGSNPNKWTKKEGDNAKSALGELKTGDIVRYLSDGHSIFVTAVNGENVTFTDCNYGGNCNIRWDVSITKSELKKTITYVQVCPVNNPNPSQPVTGGDALGCTTAYAGWYTVSSSGANINSGHNKNWNSYVGEFSPNALIYVTKATGVGRGNLGHVNYGGQERYVAMAYVGEKKTGLLGGASNPYGDWAKGNYMIDGRALDWANTSAQVRVDLYIDSRFVNSVYANQYSDFFQQMYSAETDEKNPGNYHGFSFPVIVNDPGVHNIRIVQYSANGQEQKEIASYSVETPEVKSLTVSSLPAKTSYTVGDALDVTGLKLTAVRGGNWNGVYMEGNEEVTTGFTYAPYVLDTAGTQVVTVNYFGKEATFTVDVKKADNEKPIISNVQVTNLTSEGYDVSCTVMDNDRVNRVVFPTWTALNGQDDIAQGWYDINHTATRGTQNGDNWSFHVNIADHNNEHGAYLTHIYAYDDAGNYECYGINDITVPEATHIVTFDANGGSAEFLTKIVNHNDVLGTLPEAYLEGYIFEGWFAEPQNGTRMNDAEHYIVQADMTLYAHWMPTSGYGWKLENDVLTIDCTGAMEDFFAASDALWFYARTQIRQVVVSEGVTSIGAYAFYGCDNLEEVSLPQSLQRINKLAFGGCKYLKAIVIPQKVTVIEPYAFVGDTAIQKVMFEGSAPEIGAGAFSDVVSDVYYPAGDPSWTENVRESYMGNLSWLADSV